MKKTTTLLVAGAIIGVIATSAQLITTHRKTEVALVVPPPAPIPERGKDLNYRIAQDFLKHGAVPSGSSIDGHTATMQVSTPGRLCTVKLEFNDTPSKGSDDKAKRIGWYAQGYTCVEEQQQSSR